MNGLAAAAPRRSRHELLVLAGLWMLVVIGMIYGYRVQIAALVMHDPDDALRLVQVRDLLAGQSWHDLTQYRINPAGGGGELHWSRFIDAQIAAIIQLFELFLAPVEAERWALVAYPMLLIGLLFFIFWRILRHLGDQNFVLVGLCAVATTFSFLHYFVPLRIDHHNWQLLLSLGMLWMALGQASFARGLAAAVIISLHVEISLEGLPYLVIFGGLFAFDWLRDPQTAVRLRGFACGLVLVPALWVAAMRGIDAVTGVYCDAFSRPFLAGSVATGLTLFVLMGVPRLRAAWPARLAVLAVAAAIGAAAFVASGAACLDGPFGNLSPLVRKFWYEGISEGRPIWEQTLRAMFSFTIPSLLGFAGIIWTMWRVRGGPLATDWQRLALAALGSLVLSLLVLRTTAVTHAYVLPGYIFAIIGIFRWGQSLTSPLTRVPATAAAVLALPISITAMIIAVMGVVEPDTEKGLQPTDCLTAATMPGVKALPKGTIFAALDMSATLLAETQHNVVVTGHHRNHAVMHNVITTFIGAPVAGEAYVRAADADYVAVCLNLPEFQNYAGQAPKGLAAALSQQRPPPWLAFDADASVSSLRVYRVLPPKGPVSPE